MSKLKNFVIIMPENMLFSGEIYTAVKKITLPLVVTVVTNITSGLGTGCFGFYFFALSLWTSCSPF